MKKKKKKMKKYDESDKENYVYVNSKNISSD